MMLSKTTKDKLRRLQNKVEILTLDLDWRRRQYFDAVNFLDRVQVYLDRVQTTDSADQIVSDLKAVLDEFDALDDDSWKEWQSASLKVKRSHRTSRKS